MAVVSRFDVFDSSIEYVRLLEQGFGRWCVTMTLMPSISVPGLSHTPESLCTSLAASGSSRAPEAGRSQTGTLQAQSA